MRTHWVKDKGLTHHSESVTHCGLVGWRGEIIESEHSTVQGAIFTASARLSDVDCSRCLRSAKRISETCTTNPRGNHRRRVA